MTSQSSGGSGSGLPGVTTDGKTPGGEIIAGALTAGDPNAASVPSFPVLNGSTSIVESPANQVDGDDTLLVYQASPLTQDNATSALNVTRAGQENGHQYTGCAFGVFDHSSGTAPAAQFFKNGAFQFQVDGDGVQMHGKFKVGSAVTHTLGAYTGKSLPIYDESGTLVGYAPCYA